MLFCKWLQSLRQSKGIRFACESAKENVPAGAKWCTVVTWSGQAQLNDYRSKYSKTITLLFVSHLTHRAHRASRGGDPLRRDLGGCRIIF